MKYASCFCVVLGLALGVASCKDGEPNDEGETETETGDGDGDPTTTGDGDPTTTGDGDPTTTGDGDGDPTTGDGDGDGDDTNTGHGDGDAAEDTSIYEIQDGSIPLYGWVEVHSVWVTAKRNDGLWVQEPEGGPFSGIWVYVGESSPNLDEIQVGDLVDVLGVSGEFNEVTEINALNGGVTITGYLDTPIVPDVVSVADLDATWESVLVRVEGQIEVVELPGEGEFIVNDGTASGFVDDYVFNVMDGLDEFPGFGVGATFTAVQGPLNLAGATFKIIPRSASDLEGYQPAP